MTLSESPLTLALLLPGAYIAGKSFGRRCTHRTFFVLSPNKTWEGFLGAALFTAIAGFLAPLLLAKSGWLRCSFDELALSTGDDCPRTLLWTPSRTLTLGSTQLEIPTWLGDVAPIQFHGIAMALFASLVAPFGGLFASVVKRGMWLLVLTCAWASVNASTPSTNRAFSLFSTQRTG